ncbi:transglutaminase domain-containing protein [Roseburia inulinivorans]|uniref:transglutaminase domain-containing protein n=1 Tax=Roseburia inulinivorans TaxID=360807 RepID=UPI002092DA74|nr:transglutaminase domain-containing protein [Roseburia inulinivorans]
MTKKTDSYGFVCKWIVKILIALACILIFTWNNNTLKVNAEETTYAHSDTATDASGNVVLKVEWNEPVLGQPLTFHVSATGGSGTYQFNMEAPSYSNPNENAYESVADPSRGEWIEYSKECSYQDYTFTMTASGTYNFRFHVIDKKSRVYFLRTNTYIKVSDQNYPSVRSIVETAVNQCKSETDGSDYAKALWLHDWLLQQLDYDNSLKWSSAESALTRRTGTCQAYESAYSQLLSAAGIENAETRDTYDGHTWNAVKMDGQWYQVDCTWDDSNNKYYSFDNRHLYFGLTDELMAIAHPGHEKIYTADGYGTRSASLADNYFVKNGEAASG